MELRDRLVRLIRASGERAGLGLGATLPAIRALEPRTPWPDIVIADVAARLTSEERDALLERAERILRFQFDLLGRVGVHYGTPVDWQRDPIAGRSAPLIHWSGVRYLDSEVVGDHKVTWEVNRHQWLIHLGQAWQLSGDSRYAEGAAALLASWLESNPPKRGINWCSSLENAFRVQSWIHGLRLFAGAPGISIPLREEILRSAVLQLRHIEHNLSTWFSPNTHLTGEALALLAAGCAWPEVGDAARWRALGWSILMRELWKQVLDDGVYFERAAWYQAYTLDFYVQAMQWAPLAGEVLPRDAFERIRLAACALRAITRPDGTVARLGDDDGGHALPYSVAPHGNLSATLWRAAHAIGDGSVVPPDPTTRSSLLWLEGVAAFDALAAVSPDESARQSGALRTGGWVTLVERGARAAEDHWMCFDAGPHGAMSCAHSHADALSFDLTVAGVPLIIDPGTGAYSGAERTRLRATASHNTLTVDDVDSSVQKGAFSWKSVACTRLEGFCASKGATWTTASHDGYQRLADPVCHSRTIVRLTGRYWVVLDAVTANARHHIGLTFQLAPGALVASDGARFSIHLPPAFMTLALDPMLATSIEQRTVSPAYSVYDSAPAIVAGAWIDGDTAICTALGSGREVSALRVSGRRADGSWEISHDAGHDCIAMPGGHAVTVGPASFDGSVLLMLGRDNPHAIVAAGAGRLLVDGIERRLAAEEICVLRRTGADTWAQDD